MFRNNSSTTRTLTALICSSVLILTGCPPKEEEAKDTETCLGAPIASAELFPGCSAADLRLNPQVVADPAFEGMARMEQMFGDIPEVMDIAQVFDMGRQEFETAVATVRHGDPCDANAEFDAAFDSFNSAQAEMDALVMTLESIPTDPSTPGDDVDPEASRALVFSIIADELARAVGEAAPAAETLGSLCDEVEEDFMFTSTVESLSDSRREVVFETGETVRLGWGIVIEGSITQYSQATASGQKYKDGSSYGGGMTENPNAELYQTAEYDCIELRFTPRRGTQSQVGPWTKHEINGYRDQTPTYQLEEGMRIGADDSECPTETLNILNPPEMLSVQYYLKLDLAYAGSSVSASLASELRGDSTPVPFPNDLDPNAPGNAFLTTETWKRVCRFPNTPGQTCSNTYQATDYYSMQVNPAGSACEPVLSHYIYTIEDDVPNDFESVNVSSVMPQLPFLTEPQVQSYTFKASAKLVANNAASVMFHPIGTGTSFAVFAKDPSPNVKVGLLYSRIEGYRSGKPFTYTCEPGTPVRDAVNMCGGTNPYNQAYHRLPFANQTVVNVGQSNNGQYSHYNDQIYAIDFNEGMNTPIHATRGGIVRRVVSNLNTNCAGSTGPVPGCPRFGNHVFIEHQDGTWGGYMHMAQNTATVWPGLSIKRGHHIGNVGNTGRSGGPHLHHHVVTGAGMNQNQIINANSIPIKWEAYPEGQGGLIACMVPAHNTNYRSSNN